MALNGGGGGIRTHGTRERTTVFKTAPINRSGTPPVSCLDVALLYYIKIILSREVMADNKEKLCTEVHSC